MEKEKGHRGERGHETMGSKGKGRRLLWSVEVQNSFMLPPPFPLPTLVCRINEFREYMPLKCYSGVFVCLFLVFAMGFMR
jgi:hypothetical protein